MDGPIPGPARYPTGVDALAEIDPRNADFYRANKDLFLIGWKSSAYAHAAIQSVQVSRARRHTTRSAISGVPTGDVLAIQGISTESGRYPQDRVPRGNARRTPDPRGIYRNHSVERNVRTLIDGAAAQGHRVHRRRILGRHGTERHLRGDVSRHVRSQRDDHRSGAGRRRPHRGFGGQLAEAETVKWPRLIRLSGPSRQCTRRIGTALGPRPDGRLRREASLVDVDFEIPQGLVAVIGPNGAGKSA